MRNEGHRSDFIRKDQKKSGSIFEDGRFALGALSGVLGLILIYLVATLYEIPSDRSDFVERTPEFVAVLVAFVSLFVSRQALLEQTRMRQAGVDPVLIAHLKQDPQHPLLLTLRISNVGAGAALNVNVSMPDTPLALFRTGSNQTSKSEVLNGNLPMSAILQNESHSFLLGTGPELMGKECLPPFVVELCYQDVEGSAYQSKHILDVRELTGKSAAEPAEIKIWRELQEIRKALSQR